MVNSIIVFFTFCCAAMSLAISMSSPAYAYLDPGTGSIILQSIIGSIAAVLAFGTMYWARFKQFFRRITGKDATESEAENE